MMGALSKEIVNQRADAAQREWERWDRVARVVVAAVNLTVNDLRSLSARIAATPTIGAGAVQKECERMADVLLATIEGFDWIKSPYENATERRQPETRT